jgi:hypothetical protein
VKIVERIEQAMKRGKIEGSTVDSRIAKRGESGDDSEGGKPYSCGLARSYCSINCSNVFAKIDIPLPLKFVDQHRPDSRILPDSDKSHATTVF